jgi:hypothetical protein
LTPLGEEGTCAVAEKADRIRKVIVEMMRNMIAMELTPP